MNPRNLPALTVADGAALADSRIVAAGLQIAHKTLLESVDRHSERFSRFKPLNRSDRDPSGGRPTRYLLLQRDAVTMIVAICRPTPASLDWQEAIIEAFRRMEAELTKGTQDVGTLPTQREAVAGWLAAIDERDALAAKVESDAPKVAFADAVAHSSTTYTASDAAKVLGARPHALIQALLTHGWYYREAAGRLRAYSERIQAGHLEEKVSPSRSDPDRTYLTPHITGAGLALIRDRLVTWGLEVAA